MQRRPIYPRTSHEIDRQSHGRISIRAPTATCDGLRSLCALFKLRPLFLSKYFCVREKVHVNIKITNYNTKHD